MPSHAPIATGGLRDWRGRCSHPNKSLICRGPRAACCRPSGVPPRRAAGAAQHGLRHRPVLVPTVKLAVCLALAGAGQGFPALTPVGYHAARLVEGIFKAIVARQPLFHFRAWAAQQELRARTLRAGFSKLRPHRAHVTVASSIPLTPCHEAEQGADKIERLDLMPLRGVPDRHGQDGPPRSG